MKCQKRKIKVRGKPWESTKHLHSSTNDRKGRVVWRGKLSMYGNNRKKKGKKSPDMVGAL